MPPHVKVQQDEINRQTNVAAQWSTGNQLRVENNYNTHIHRYTCNHSMPNMSPVVPDYNGWIHYNSQGWQDNHFDWQVPEQRGFPQAPYNHNNANFLHILHNYSSKQAIIQMTLNSIPEYDGSNKTATISWLDHIEMVAENTGIDPIEVGIGKLKGFALGDITASVKRVIKHGIFSENN